MTPHEKLVSAAIKYDGKLYTIDGNSARLGLILRGIERMESESKALCCAHHALTDNFSDRILTAFEKALKLPISYSRGSDDIDRRPISCSDLKSLV